MIPATRPYEARFKHETTGPDGKTRTHYTEKPVIAWDKQGQPLVADKRGVLVAATGWTNFAGVHEAEPPVIAAIPGGGWVAEFTDEEGAARWPIVAWTVRADGSCTPLTVDRDGMCDDPTDATNFGRIYHPDDEPDTQTP